MTPLKDQIHRLRLNDFLAEPVTQEKLVQILTSAGLRPSDGYRAPPVAGPPLEPPEAGEILSVGSENVIPEADVEILDTAAATEVPQAKVTRGSLDPNLMASLLSTIGSDTVAELLDDVLSEADALPAMLDQARVSGGARRVDVVLHGFKGAAAALGLRAAADLAQHLRTAVDWTTVEAEAVSAAAHAETAQAKALLRRWVEDRKAA